MSQRLLETDFPSTNPQVKRSLSREYRWLFSRIRKIWKRILMNLKILSKCFWTRNNICSTQCIIYLKNECFIKYRVLKHIFFLVVTKGPISWWCQVVSKQPNNCSFFSHFMDFLIFLSTYLHLSRLSQT